MQPPELRDNEKLAVGVVEIIVFHGLRGEIDAGRHAGLRVDVARGRHGADALDEGEPLLWNGNRTPAELADGALFRRDCRRGLPKWYPMVLKRLVCRTEGRMR